MHTIRRFLKAQLGKSIWAPGAIPEVEQKYAGEKRVAYPLADMFLFYSGVQAVEYGAPSVGKIFPAVVNDVFSWVFAISAIVCLVSVLFTNLGVAEFIGKFFLFSLLFGYAVCLWVLSLGDSSLRGFITGVCGAMAVMIASRMAVLAFEWKVRSLERKRRAEVAKLVGGVL